MTRPLLRLLSLILATVAGAPALIAQQTVSLTELDLSHLHVAGWSPARVNLAFNGKPLSIAGRKFERGIGTRATTTLWLELDGKVQRFEAMAGVDDVAVAAAAVRFMIIGDGRKLWDSGTVKHREPARPVDVNLTGVRSLLLVINHAGDREALDLADWAEPRFTFAGSAPRTVNAPREDAVILTPKPPVAPRINGPTVYGCRPGNPFLHRIPTTGERPIRFTAEGLPRGLQLDANTGIITGTAPARGTHVVTFRARNARGTATQKFKIVSGDTLALTPHLGWNHWYAHYNRITDQMVREAADLMVKTGMADVGYSYVNIDDCWENAKPDAKRKPDELRFGPYRDEKGNVVPNKHFPDMRALTDYIHSLGLKAGIYSSPGPWTCGGYVGSYEHEEQDARQYAAWGFDFLKYDWCSYRQVVKDDRTRPVLMKPYQQMGDILKSLPRDIVFNLCQYGMGEVWEWGAQVGGHSWRTAGDLGGELNRIFPVALKNAEHRAWSKPGAWNDPDYIQIGYIGEARTNSEPKPCPMTATEQYAFMSMWSLMASPLIFSGDMARLDEFTLNVLCNPEVIAINQDPLGECARVIRLTPETFVMIKQLEDGSRAIGLCNQDEVAHDVSATWQDLGITGKQRARDVWRHRNLGEFDREFRATVPRHGVVLVRLTSAQGI